MRNQVEEPGIELLRTCDVTEWRRIVRRARLGSPAKTVAGFLADYADWDDGGNAFPGVVRLAAVTEIHEVTVRNALKKLRRLGLVLRTERGSNYGRNGAGMHDRYQLTVPINIMTPACPIEMLPPDELPVERERKPKQRARKVSPSPGFADVRVESGESAVDTLASASPALGDETRKPDELAVDNELSVSPGLGVSARITEPSAHITESWAHITESWARNHRVLGSPTFHRPSIDLPSPFQFSSGEYLTWPPGWFSTGKGDQSAVDEAEPPVIEGRSVTSLGPLPPPEADYAGAQMRMLLLGPDAQRWIEQARTLLRERNRGEPSREAVLITAARLVDAAPPAPDPLAVPTAQAPIVGEVVP